MIRFQTERLIAKSEMIVADDRLVEKEAEPTVIDIFNLRKRTGLESGFKFYDKADETVEVCHIGITWQRNRFEVSYGTEKAFEGQGFMKEALSHLVGWIFSNTKEPEIWGLPNGIVSEHILSSNGFTYYGALENNSSMKWYRVLNPNVA